MAFLDQGGEGGEQPRDVMKVEARRRLVKDKQRGILLLLSDEVGQLHALVLTTGEGRGTLSQPYVSQSHVSKWLETFCHQSLPMLPEEVDGLCHRHVEHVVDVLAMKAHVEHLALEALAVAGFAGEREIGHKLHLDRDHARSLTLLAASALGIEREILGREAHLLG